MEPKPGRKAARHDLHEPGVELTGGERHLDVNIGARAAVIVPVLRLRPRKDAPSREPAAERSPAARLDEAVGLTEAIDLDIQVAEHFVVPHPRPATLIGTGKLKELEGALAAADVEVAIVDHPLTPVQQRNLERAWKVKVLDRTGLILEIFGRRARTKEGRLQVELAHLTFQKSRLVRSWTHLERQRGGFGFLGGPGETQIEADRRIIQDRIDGIRRDLETVVRTRDLHRKGRERVPFPIVALVGYTNAGKSTLFNALTASDVFAKDQLFATLDPTMRELILPGGRKVILSDTVGFISELPTTLIAAFRATLEEVLSADLILHVRDIAHGDSAAQAADVADVLGELGVDVATAEAPILEVWNKCDLMDEAARIAADAAAQRMERAPVMVSARTGEGLDDLKTAIETFLAADHWALKLDIPPAAGAFVHWLYEHADIQGREPLEDGTVRYDIRIPPAHRDVLLSRLSGAGGRVVA